MLVGYEIGYRQLGPTGLVGYLPSHPTCAHGMIVNFEAFTKILTEKLYQLVLPTKKSVSKVWRPYYFSGTVCYHIDIIMSMSFLVISQRVKKM